MRYTFNRVITHCVLISSLFLFTVANANDTTRVERNDTIRTAKLYRCDTTKFESINQYRRYSLRLDYGEMIYLVKNGLDVDSISYRDLFTALKIVLTLRDTTQHVTINEQELFRKCAIPCDASPRN